MEGTLYDFVKEIFDAARHGTNSSHAIYCGDIELNLYMFDGMSMPDGGHVWLNENRDSVVCVHMPRIDHGGQYVSEVRASVVVHRGNNCEWPVELSISDQTLNGGYGLHAEFVYPADPPVGFQQDVFDSLRRMLREDMLSHKEENNDDDQMEGECVQLHSQQGGRGGRR